mmetsp:Transcript_70716/g.194004  ORF Transcript_70716/g.194004 Transcript_70716/m.194004 type:complete len:121 (+) Transcript_70716:231-593(+)
MMRPLHSDPRNIPAMCAPPRVTSLAWGRPKTASATAPPHILDSTARRRRRGWGISTRPPRGVLLHVLEPREQAVQLRQLHLARRAAGLERSLRRHAGDALEATDERLHLRGGADAEHVAD